MFTVGTPDEMTRVISVLYPEAKPGARILLYLTEDTVLRHRATLKALPAGADLNMVVRGRSYRLRRGGPGAEGLLAEIRSNLALEPRDERLLEEALWHLGQPLRDARVRVLALEPGGPRALAAWPRIDPATKRAVVDAIDPASLAAAMGSVAGQMLLVVGRVEGDVLHVRPSSGPEHSLPINDLLKAPHRAGRQIAAAAGILGGGFRRPDQRPPRARHRHPQKADSDRDDVAHLQRRGNARKKPPVELALPLGAEQAGPRAGHNRPGSDLADETREPLGGRS
jgi:hypothetical protein